MSTLTTVNRPQFVALHVETNARPGQDITQASIRSANLFAGDLLNDAPLPGGATSQGMVLASILPVQVSIVGVAPDHIRFGHSTGTVEGNVFFTDSAGQIFGATVKFEFHTSLCNDTGPFLMDRDGHASSTVPALSGP